MISNRNYTNPFTMIRKLQNISFYPIHIFYNDLPVYPDSPNMDTDPIFCDPDLYQTLSRNSGPIYDPDDQDIFYAAGKEDDFICIIGPLCLQSLSHNKMLQYARVHHIQKKFDFQIIQGSITQALDTLTLVFSFLKELPAPYPLPNDGSSAIIADTENIQGNDPTFWFMNSDSDAQSSYQSEQNSFSVQVYQLNNAEKDIPHTPYELEMEILSALQSSDKEKFNSLLQTITNYSGGSFAHTSAKYKEYSIVSMVTVLTRAAITGGVSPNDAYALSDTLLYKTSLCRHEQEYLQIFQESLDSFFKLVKKNKDAQNQSIHIRDCKTYISHHLNKELNPDILAEHLGISKNYLLRLFPQYENMTLMQYILRERVLAAANMLKYSDFDIMRIATYFHFQTQSHFGVVFKKYLGMSPAAYRKKNKPVGF